MESLFKKYSIQKINKELRQMTQNDRVNNLKLFVASDESKLSVTLFPEEEYKNQYHGLHPALDTGKLLELLGEHRPNSTEKFWAMVAGQQKAHYYMNLLPNESGYLKIGEVVLVDEDKTEVEEVLLGRALLQMASHFGFKIKGEKDTLDALHADLLRLWREQQIGPLEPVEEKHEDAVIRAQYWDLCYNKEPWIDFLGIWPSAITESLSKAYRISEKENELSKEKELFIEKSTEGNGGLLRALLSFDLKYLSYFKLRNTSVYYSGVMPRVLKLDYNEAPSTSLAVKYLVAHVARTTYATVDFMDNSGMIYHPFFCDDSGTNKRHHLMLAFDAHEDEMQKKYLYTAEQEPELLSQREYEKAEIAKINRYLSSSLNTHTIAVSANIETNDEFLLIGKRSNQSIDAGEHYCSVNGQSEFRDENVSFYRKSVYEDVPTMDYDSKYRIDLNHEIQREAIAELGISAFENEWTYYGVSYLSINNSRETSAKGRRMHFNVLTKNRTPLDFEEVVKNREFATEKFENSTIKGLKVLVSGNEWGRFRKRLRRLFEWVYRNKSTIFLMLLLGGFIINKRLGAISATTWVEIALLAGYLAIILGQLFKTRKIRKLKSGKHFISKKYMEADAENDKKRSLNLTSVLNDLAPKNKKKDWELHAIFRVMFMLYFLDKAK